LTPFREADIRQRNMRAFHISGILCVVLPFAAIETANAAGIVSHNGGHAIRTASADLLAGPGRGGKKNRGFRFAAPNVVAAARHSDAGTAALGGSTLTLSGAVIKTGLGTLQIGQPTISISGTTISAGTLRVSDAAAVTLAGSAFGALNGTTSISGGTLQIRPNTESLRINPSGGTVVFNPAAITNSVLSSGVVSSSDGTINLLRVESGTLTLAGGTVHRVGLNEGPAGGTPETSGGMGAITLTGSSTIDFASGTGSNLLFSNLIYTSGGVIGIRNWTGAGLGLVGANTFTGTLTLEASQTLGTAVIDSSESIVVIGNGVAPPPPVGDASSQGAQPVPEPSAAALLALSAAALLTRRARNRK
jgi:hypothetical protein